MTHKVYISGAITGVPNFEEVFQKAEDQLVSAGYEVVNPAKIRPWSSTDVCDLNGPADEMIKHTWQCNMRHDIAVMALECDKLAFLPGWENSKGATVEISLAIGLGFEVKPLAEWLEAR